MNNRRYKILKSYLIFGMTSSIASISYLAVSQFHTASLAIAFISVALWISAGTQLALRVLEAIQKVELHLSGLDTSERSKKRRK